MITCYDILGPLCEILKERVTYILTSSECPPDLRAQLDSIIYASTRMEIEELQTLRQIIAKKYGTAYVQKADTNGDKLVNVNLVEKLRIKPASDVFVTIRLKQLCKEHKIPFEFPAEIGNDFSAEPMQMQNPYGDNMNNPFGPNPFGPPGSDAYGNANPYAGNNNNPYGPPGGNNNPYGPPPGGNNNPFGPAPGGNNNNPYGGSDFKPPGSDNNPFGPQGGNNNPYGPPPGGNNDPFGKPPGSDNNPFGPAPGGNNNPYGGNDSFAKPPGSDNNPFGAAPGGNNPYGPPAGGNNNSFAKPPENNNTLMSTERK